MLGTLKLHESSTSRWFLAFNFVNFSFQEIAQNNINIEKSPKYSIQVQTEKMTTQNVCY